MKKKVRWNYEAMVSIIKPSLFDQLAGVNRNAIAYQVDYDGESFSSKTAALKHARNLCKTFTTTMNGGF